MYYQNFIHIRALRNAMRMNGIEPVPCTNLICFPDGIDLFSDCVECCTVSRLKTRLSNLINDSKIDVDVDTTYKFIESLDARS